MSNAIFLDGQYYQLTNDSNAIRELENYQIIRDEVNRRFNPLAGGTDWEKVFACCERLAKAPGMDFLITGYYAVASLKVHGLAGFANGLELLSYSLSNLSEPDTKTAKMRKEVLDWVNGKVVQELKSLKPTYEALRELYRAESHCERLHQLLEAQQPDHLVDFEGVGFALFEHIDRIETQYHTLMKRQHKEEAQQVPSVPKARHWLWCGVMFLVGLAVYAFGQWAYGHYAWFHKDDYARYRATPIIQTEAALSQYQNQVSKSQLARWEDDFIALYSGAATSNMQQSVEKTKLDALSQIATLRTLYPESAKVQQVDKAFSAAQKKALEQTEYFIERFRDIRTKMANISLLAQKQRWSALQRNAKSLEDFAVSLSPVYGRVDYVQTLIKQGDLVEAKKEFNVLKKRLNNLSWQIAQLDNQLQKQITDLEKTGNK